MSGERPIAPFTTLMRTKLRQPQFYWFLGHFLTLYHYFRYCLSFNQVSLHYQYRSVLFYVAVTYSIVLYQFYKSGQLKLTMINTHMRSLDNLQYFIMSFFLYLGSGYKMISSAIISPVIFAFFHSTNYFKENLLPFLPLNSISKSLLDDKITFFITNYNAKCLVIAQNSEILALIHVIVGLPLMLPRLLIGFNFGNLLNLVVSFSYIWFFKLRYLQSEQMRKIVLQYSLKIDLLIQQRYPHLFAKWNGIKELNSRLFAMIPV